MTDKQNIYELNLERIKKKKKNLISETHTATKQDPSDDEHGKVLSSSINNRTENKENPSNQHGYSSSKRSGCVGGEESGG